MGRGWLVGRGGLGRAGDVVEWVVGCVGVVGLGGEIGGPVSVSYFVGVQQDFLVLGRCTGDTSISWTFWSMLNLLGGVIPPWSADIIYKIKV